MHENNKMSNMAKTVAGISAAIVVLIMSSLVMSACNTRMPQQQVQEQTQNTEANTGAVQNDGNAGAVQNQTANIISTEDAKAAALSHAGIAAENAQWYRSELDRDDGRRVYEIEFDAGEYEYDYEIDAQTGEILKFDKEIR